MLDVKSLSYKHALCSLDIRAKDQTFALGAAFADAVKKDWSDPASVARIDKVAIIALKDSGKSVFVGGIKSALHQPIKLEDKTYYPDGAQHGKSHPQALWSTIEAGLLRHVDAGYAAHYFTRMLNAYRFDYLERQKSGGVDIIENANYLRENVEFDVAIQIDNRRDLGAEAKRVHIFATTEFQKRAGFQSFLARAQDICSALEIA
ncbi:MAG: hypothetical protein ACK4VI_05045 [Alphaproteobacteria bacterium]